MDWNGWKAPLLLGAGLAMVEALFLVTSGRYHPVVMALGLGGLVVGTHRVLYDTKQKLDPVQFWLSYVALGAVALLVVAALMRLAPQA